MVLVTVALLLVLVALGYVYLTWNYSYWRKRKVPGPKPSLLTGNYPNLYKMKQHVIYDLNEIYSKNKNKYDAVGIYQGRSPQLLVTSPELAQRIFVSDFKSFHDNELGELVDEKSDYILANNIFSMKGDKWKQRRALVTPGLTASRIKTVYPVTNQVCGKLTDFIKRQIRIGSKDGINAKDISLRFTTEAVTDCVLGLGAQSFTDNPTPVIEKITSLFDQSWTFLVNFALVSLFPILLKIKKLRFVPKHAEDFFVELMQTAIDARQNQMKVGKTFERVDFLDYILQLAEKRNLNTRQLTAFSMTFLIDGFDTTATVLAHTLLLLGRHSEVAQKRLRHEILAHLNDEGFVDFDQLNDLPFLEACVQESLRLFPPLSFSNKICSESIELPNRNGSSFTVEKGTTVVIPHACFTMDEDHFSDAQAFQPDRFMEPDAAKKFRERGVLRSFGDGPRICIGMRFAMTQIKAAIVEILMNFNVTVNPKTRVDNRFDPQGFVTRLQGDIWLDFEVRES
ncbi:hypothetical protein KR222_010714 [Zaprionus bogoriensis]|nr:hypothetical protein KR222_010714 [Zaprionus bogoriensis]